MLTWLQEEQPGVFLIATANDISAWLNNHPELLRKGRFDEIWFSDLPSEEERKEIFRIHLDKAKRNPENFDLDALAQVRYYDEDTGRTFDYTGAEIQYAVGDAIQEAFSRGHGQRLEIGSENDITNEMVMEKLSIIKPMSKIGHEPINKMRRWAKDNARNVSYDVQTLDRKAKPSGVGKSNAVSLRTRKKTKPSPVECDL